MDYETELERFDIPELVERFESGESFGMRGLNALEGAGEITESEYYEAHPGFTPEGEPAKAPSSVNYLEAPLPGDTEE